MGAFEEFKAYGCYAVLLPRATAIVDNLKIEQSYLNQSIWGTLSIKTIPVCMICNFPFYTVLPARSFSFPHIIVVLREPFSGKCTADSAFCFTYPPCSRIRHTKLARVGFLAGLNRGVQRASAPQWKEDRKYTRAVILTDQPVMANSGNHLINSHSTG